MITEKHIRRDTPAGEIFLDIYPAGEDIAAVLTGGERPHIGCAVMSVPRGSLTGDGSISSTSSVLNVTGHKDEYICRMVSEELCRKYNALSVCTGGFHTDAMTQERISEVLDAVRSMLSEC